MDSISPLFVWLKCLVTVFIISIEGRRTGKRLLCFRGCTRSSNSAIVRTRIALSAIPPPRSRRRLPPGDLIRQAQLTSTQEEHPMFLKGHAVSLREPDVSRINRSIPPKSINQ
ncbi:MAG: hypothetical protein J2P36_17525 [Ktedonobacteraceae bacterium]|nr:hypothetical protein [Ktedonobacteraceae bacterium]